MTQHRDRERGAATAEYTVGTLGACTIAYWLARITIGGPDPGWYDTFLGDLIRKALAVPGSLGGGDGWAWRWLM